MPNRLSVFCFIFCLINGYVFSSPADSTQEKRVYKTVVKYFYEKDFIRGNVRLYTPDTSLINVDKITPAFLYHHNYLGTAGSASEPQIFSYDKSVFTYTGFRSYKLQFLNEGDFKSIRTNKRLTELNYHSGAFKEQYINLLHSQNITKTWNAGFSFDRLGVKEFMNYSNTFRSRFSLFTWYASPNKKYNLFAHAFWNRISNGVNGGLVSDSLFDNTNITNLGIKGLAYNISNASHSLREKEFYVSQYYDVGKVTRDTLGNILHRKPPLRLHHQISFSRNTFAYSDIDPDTNFYSDFYYGNSTYDSLHLDKIKSRLALQIPADSLYTSGFFRKWSSGLFTEYEHVDYEQRQDSTWDNFSIGANVSLRTDTASIEVLVEGSYIFRGIDEENYLVEAKLFSPEYSFGRIGISASASQSSTDFIFKWYEGNNFAWKINFEPVKCQVAGINYALEKYRLYIEAKHFLIDDFVYMNLLALPSQLNETISITQIRLEKNFTYRYWHLDNTVYYQETNNDNALHLPSYITDQSLYFEKNYFKNALRASFGTSVNFNSSYFANAFMPANTLFYLQDDVKTGGYWRFDIFFIAKIKTARIFLKLENALDNVIENSYYLTPHYPMPGRVFKFGLTWRFFDQ